MDAIVAPLEFDVARERIAQRLPTGSSLRTAGWADVPLALRERAFFSAGVESARAIGELQSLVLGAGSRGEFVARARGFLQAHGIARRPTDAAENADLTNIGGTRRLELVYEQNLQAARGYGWWREGQDSDALDAFPAQELLREEDRREPRDWVRRWAEAGGRLFGGRMIALKSDPVWGRISRFGTPWPPYDFGSGMGVEDIERAEAEALGLIGPDETAQGDERSFNAELSASVRGLAEARVAWLKQALPDLDLRFSGGSVWLRGDGESRALAQPQGRRTLEDLAPSEARAVTEYTRRPTGPELNQAMRRGDLTPAQRGHAERLRASLQRLPVVPQREVYRWVGRFEGIERWRPGFVIDDAGFVSASVVDRAGYGGRDGPVRMVIRHRAAVDISPKALAADDREVLLRGGRLRVLDRRSVSGVDTIFAEELP